MVTYRNGGGAMGKRFAEGERIRYAAAMLRVVLALKRDPDGEVEEIVERVIGETGVDEVLFRSFLTSHTESMARVVSRRHG